jgi:hypothetical protein
MPSKLFRKPGVISTSLPIAAVITYLSHQDSDSIITPDIGTPTGGRGFYFDPSPPQLLLSVIAERSDSRVDMEYDDEGGEGGQRC